MNNDKNPIWKIVETHLIKWMLGIATGGIVVAVVFYFNTSYVMAQNTETNKKQAKDISKIKDDVESIKTVPTLNQKDITQVKKDVDRIEKKTDKIDDKLDKMMVILIELKQK